MKPPSLLAEQCVKLAQRALDGDASLEQFRAEWPVEADLSKPLWNVMHLVENFLVDADIRARDADYDAAQRARIKAVIAGLGK